MKKCIVIFSSLFLLSFALKAQLTETLDGDVGIGTETPERKLEVYEGNVQVYKENLVLKANNSYDPGDIIFFTSTNSELARMYLTSTHLLMRGTSGSGGIRMGLSNEHVGILANASATYELYVAGDFYCTGSYPGSDARYKTNIVDLNTNKIDNLKLINAVEYNYDPDEFIKRSCLLGNDDSLSIDVEEIKVERADFFDQTRIGFLAQDVRAIYPELVKEDEFGYLAINYDGFIPIVIEVIKEQQNTIEDLVAQVNELNASKTKSSILQDLDEGFTVETNQSTLSQNMPNPFSENTVINVNIAESAEIAVLYIYNMNGNQIESYQIFERGNSNITISGNSLNPGMYLYSLIVDGREVDTKRMILTQ